MSLCLCRTENLGLSCRNVIMFLKAPNFLVIVFHSLVKYFDLLSISKRNVPRMNPNEKLKVEFQYSKTPRNRSNPVFFIFLVQYKCHREFALSGIIEKALATPAIPALPLFF